MPKSSWKLKMGFAAVAALALIAGASPAGASTACTTGGITPAATDNCAPTAKARLSAEGQLIRPAGAPARVKLVVAAANRIATKPYLWGGGHGRRWDRGYDCSGAVSFALHGGRFLESPLPSGPMESWAEDGEGRWITVYANPGHAYMTVAGFRFDTAGDGGEETGPRWHEALPDHNGFVARHPSGF